MFLPVPGLLGYGDIALFVPMNGVNGSTTFTRGGSNGLSLSAAGNAQISTAQSKWGGGSGYFDGTGDYVTGNYNAALGLTWTIECWLYVTSLASARGIWNIGFRSYRGPRIYIETDGAVIMFAGQDSYDNTAYHRTTAAGAITTNSWIHLAVVKTPANSAPVIYVNGTASSASSAWVSNTVYYTDYTLDIGYARTYDGYLGYMNDFAIWNTAKYTGNFTAGQLVFRPPDLSVRQIREPSFVSVSRLGL